MFTAIQAAVRRIDSHPMAHDETPKERVDRELMELLNELRVALPGVEVLFAFLLTLPFSAGWESISSTERNVYFTAVLTAASAIALLIAPSAHHRLRFRDEVKEHMLQTSSKLAIGGLVLLAASVGLVLHLLTTVVHGSGPAAIVAGMFGVAVALLWFVVPFRYRRDSFGHS